MQPTRKAMFMHFLEKLKSPDVREFFYRVSLPDHPELETLVNPIENLQYKIDYIDKTYNDNLEHKYDSRVKIIDWYATVIGLQA